MVETLTERNLDLEEKVREMKETVIDLVSQRNVHGHEFHDKPLIVHLLKPDTHILYWVKCRVEISDQQSKSFKPATLHS